MSRTWVKVEKEGEQFYETSLVIGFRHIRDWGIFPWYHSYKCQKGCCIKREFSWLFGGGTYQRIRLTASKLDLQKLDLRQLASMMGIGEPEDAEQPKEQPPSIH